MSFEREGLPQDLTASPQLPKSVNFKDIMNDNETTKKLTVMVIAWFVSCYGFYLMNFYMKYIPGNIYENSIYASIAQFIGVLSSGAFCQKFGPRKALVASFSIASFFGYSLALSMWKFPETIPFFVFFASFGIASSFHIGYLAN